MNLFCYSEQEENRFIILTCFRYAAILSDSRKWLSVYNSLPAPY